jgi:hypothetical protein
MSQIYIVLFGQLRYPDLLKNILKSLSNNQNFISGCISTWTDQTEKIDDEIRSLAYQAKIEFVFSEPRTDFEMPGNYLRQIYLTRKAVDHLRNNGLKNEDIVLRVRPDLRFLNYETLPSLISNLSNLAAKLEPDKTFTWVSSATILEPFHACDTLLAATAAQFENVKCELQDESMAAVRHGYCFTKVRPEVSFFSRLTGYSLSEEYIDYLYNKQYMRLFNRIEHGEIFRELPSRHIYNQTLTAWLNQLERIYVGFPINPLLDDILMERSPPRHVSIYSGVNAAENYMFKIAEYKWDVSLYQTIMSLDNVADVPKYEYCGENTCMSDGGKNFFLTLFRKFHYGFITT